VNGNLLGTVSQFRVNFAKPIQEGLKKNASYTLAKEARKKIKELK
jgi:hypothetical protein